MKYLIIYLRAIFSLNFRIFAVEDGNCVLWKRSSNMAATEQIVWLAIF